MWDQGGPVTPGPRAAVQLRNNCRGHSLHSAWKGEKAHVGRRRGRKETGRGENAEGKKGPRGVRGTDTQKWGSAPAPHPPRNRVHSAGRNASNLPPTVAEAPPGWCVSHLVISDSLRSPELQSARLLRPWISQARILEWVAIPSARGSSRPRDRTWISHFAGEFFTV